MEEALEYAPDVASMAIPMAASMMVPGLNAFTIPAVLGNIALGAGGYGLGGLLTEREAEDIAMEAGTGAGLEAALMGGAGLASKGIPFVGGMVRPVAEMIKPTVQQFLRNPELMEWFGDSQATIDKLVRGAGVDAPPDSPALFLHGTTSPDPYDLGEIVPEMKHGLVGTTGQYFTEGPTTVQGYAFRPPQYVPGKEEELLEWAREAYENPEVKKRVQDLLGQVPEEADEWIGTGSAFMDKSATRAGELGPYEYEWSGASADATYGPIGLRGSFEANWNEIEETMDNLATHIEKSREQGFQMGDGGFTIEKHGERTLPETANKLIERMLNWGIEVDPKLYKAKPSKGHVRPVNLKIEQPLDLDGEIPLEEVEDLFNNLSIRADEEGFPNKFTSWEGLMETVLKQRGLDNDEVMEMMLDIEAGQTFPLKGWEAMQVLRGATEELSQNMAKSLHRGEIPERAAGDAPYAIGNIVREALQEYGYDGITHIGGSRTGRAPHRVFVAFEGDQIKDVTKNTSYIEAILRGAFLGGAGGIAAREAFEGEPN
jgi:hypothetical protein